MLRIIGPEHLDRTSDPAFDALITSDAAKSLARIDGTDEDTLIADLVKVATATIGDYIETPIAECTWVAQVLDDPFMGRRSHQHYLHLPGPVTGNGQITTVEYRSTENADWTALGTDDYEIFLRRGRPTMPAQVRLAEPHSSWSEYRVTYVRGWATTAAVPDTLKHVARALVGEMLSKREMSSDYAAYDGARMPYSLKSMLRRYRTVGRRYGGKWGASREVA